METLYGREEVRRREIKKERVSNVCGEGRRRGSGGGIRVRVRVREKENLCER